MFLSERVARLTERCKADDEDALIEIINCTKPVLVFKARLPAFSKIVSAADILQEVYMRFWERRRIVSPPAALAWLVQAARCRMIDQRRADGAQKRHAIIVPLHEHVRVSEGSGLRSHEALVDPHSHVEARALERERNHLLHGAVNALPEAYRRVVWAQTYGETAWETSARFGVPLGTVKSRRSYAYARLRKILQPVKEAL